jgi:hypothetical protein
MITIRFSRPRTPRREEVKMAEGERAIIMRLSPFFDARIFAGQFGTQEVREPLLEGSRRQNFRERHRVRAIPLKLAEILL